MQSINNYVEWPRFSKIQVYAFEKFEKDLSPTHCCKVFLLITHCFTYIEKIYLGQNEYKCQHVVS